METKVEIKVRKNRGRVIGVDHIDHVENLTVNTTGWGAPEDRDYVPPAARRPLFGREAELDRIDALLEDGHPVLLHGLAGIGKTALAAHAAQRWHTAATDRSVLWVSNVGEATVEGLCDAIARHLRAEELSRLRSELKPDALRSLLAEQPALLLVLDHIADESAARRFIEQCLPQGLPLVATSDRGYIAFGHAIPLDGLASDAAVALFLDRCGPGVGAEMAGTVRMICELLEGHPFALVVAAGKLRAQHLPVTRLLERLESEKARLDTLAVGDLSIQASLRLAVSDLPPESTRLLALLSACFGEDAALPLLAVLAETDELATEDRLGALVERSLVERVADRFRAPLLVRDLGRSMLGDDVDAVRGRVLDWVKTFVESHDRLEAADLDELEQELGLIAGAIRYAATQEAWTDVLALLRIVGWPERGLLEVRGYWSELIRLGDLGAEAARCAGDTVWEARWLHNTANVLLRQCSYEQAHLRFEACYPLYEARADDGARRGAASVRLNLGIVALALGRYDEAEVQIAESRTAFAALEAELDIARSVHEQGRLSLARGDFAGAAVLFRESLARKRAFRATCAPGHSTGADLGIALSTLLLGHVAYERGAYGEADRWYAESLAAYEALTYREGIASAQLGQANVSLERGLYGEATHGLLEACAATFERLQDLGGSAEVWLAQGRLAVREGRLAEAAAYFQRSHVRYQNLGMAAGRARCLYEQGCLAVEQGAPEQATRALASGLAIWQRLGNRAGEVRCVYAQGCAELLRQAWEAARTRFEESLTLSTDQGLQHVAAQTRYRLGMLAHRDGYPEDALWQYDESLRLIGDESVWFADQVRAALESARA